MCLVAPYMPRHTFVHSYNGRTPNFKRPSTPQNSIPTPPNPAKIHFRRFPTFYSSTTLFFGRPNFRHFLTSIAFLPRILRSNAKMDCAKLLGRLFCFRCTYLEVCTTKFHQTRFGTSPEHDHGRLEMDAWRKKGSWLTKGSRLTKGSWLTRVDFF